MRHITSTVGRKIGIAYILICSLFALIGLVTLVRLGSMADLVDNLTTTLTPDMVRSQTIFSSLERADDLVQTYMRDKSRDTQDRVAMTFEEVKMLLAQSQAGQIPPNRTLVDLNECVREYLQSFQELARETRFQQMLVRGALQVERPRVEDQIAVLRTALNARPEPKFFRVLDNAHTSVTRMLLAFAEYTIQGDERVAVILETSARQAQQEFTHLGQVLRTDRARQAAQEATQGIDAFLLSFDRIRASNNRQNQLFTTIDTELKPRIDACKGAIQLGLKHKLTIHSQTSRKLMENASIELLSALCMALLIAGGIGYRVTRNITAPLQAVATTAETIADHDLRLLRDNLISMSRGNTEFFFQTWAKPLGYTRQDEVGQMARSFDHIITQLAEAENAFRDMGTYLHEMARAATSVAEGNLDVSIREQSADDLLARAMGTMVRNLAGTREQVLHYQHQLHDLVDERTAQLQEATRRAESATEAKSIFLARMSHEIRTPLSGILSMAELAREASADPIVSGYLKKVQSAANTLQALLNDILDFSKIEAGRMHLENTHFDLDDLLTTLSDMAGVLAAEKGLDFIISVAPDVPYAFQGDPLRLGQILHNLVSNAIKFTTRGSVTVSISQTGGRDSVCSLHVEVADTGIGIAPEALSTLFDSFTQAERSTSRQYGGSGLGLSICKHLVELMEGRIWAHSTPGSGSSFHFTVQLPSQEPRNPVDVSALRHARILILDGTTATRENLRVLLAAASASVTCTDTCANAEAACRRAISTSPFDLLIVDVRPPDSDGLSCIRRLQSSCGTLPPIILTTPQTTPHLIAEVGQLGISHILQQPVLRTDLWQLLVRILQPAPARARKELVPLPDNPRFDGARVLVVEDNRINQEVAKALLHKVGVEVTLADSGQSALELAHANRYDLILMDIQMPGMDGLEATRRLRADDAFRNLPILAMTAHSMAADREESRAAGMNAHLTKPVTPAALYGALAQWLSSETPDGPPAPIPPVRERLHGLKEIDIATAQALFAGGTPAFTHFIEQFIDHQTHFSDRFGQAVRTEDRALARTLLAELVAACTALGAHSCRQAGMLLDEVLETETLSVVMDRAGNLQAHLDMLLAELRGVAGP